MKKHNLKKLFYLLFLAFGIISCRQQDGLLETQNDERTFNLFNKNNSYQYKDFQSDSSIGKLYALDFQQAYYSYDLKNGTNYTGINVKGPITDSYINFRVHSQIIEDENGNIYMYFPVIKNRKVTDIYFSTINKENTLLGFYKLNNTAEEYNDIFSAFEKVFVHPNEKTFSKSEDVTDVGEVVIVGPRKPTNGTGITGPGQCEVYGQCNNPGGGSGSSGGSGGGGGGIPVPSPPLPPDNPITDINDFLKCLDPSKPANLTVYAAKMFSSSPSGHAFISITQGSNTMTYGFYPKNSGLEQIIGPGQMGNDSGHAYTTAWNIGNITPAQLQEIIKTSSAFANTNYDIRFNNCVDFAIIVLNNVGINMTPISIDTPTSFSNSIQYGATSTNGNAPQTKRNCK
ncbi:hypothetical protein ACQ7CX_19535 [Chryseobacterium arthrosphaerae]|uniref:hypothetical protein n=1 Tax=Chryseobacterium arthrosphaerae TaxID=651561 RepID=UPI001BB0C5C5|nr:hypothetical protein [Chryseobacterium arthrosphaerae]QUY55981.1 hypothetical protein I2F65_01025 [Chryseobacterium arthrosphaerae]